MSLPLRYANDCNRVLDFLPVNNFVHRIVNLETKEFGKLITYNLYLRYMCHHF